MNKARDPRTLRPTLRKVREGWGTLSLLIRAEGWATRHPAWGYEGRNKTEQPESHLTVNDVLEYFDVTCATQRTYFHNL